MVEYVSKYDRIVGGDWKQLVSHELKETCCYDMKLSCYFLNHVEIVGKNKILWGGDGVAVVTATETFPFYEYDFPN